MIPFELHIMCNVDCNKTGKFEIDTNHWLHFKITCSQNQKYHYIAITEQFPNGTYKVRDDLGLLCGEWKATLNMIPKLLDMYKMAVPITNKDISSSIENIRKDFQNILTIRDLLNKTIDNFFNDYIK